MLEVMRFDLGISLAAMGLLLCSCSTNLAPSSKQAQVTVEQLLVAPDRFDGAQVGVIGYFLMPMVGDITIQEAEPGSHPYGRESGIRLELDPTKRNLMVFQLKRCVVRGTFHASHAGRTSSIGEITALELARQNF